MIMLVISLWYFFNGLLDIGFGKENFLKVYLRILY